jgi:hypothetical protein
MLARPDPLEYSADLTMLAEKEMLPAQRTGKTISPPLKVLPSSQDRLKVFASDVGLSVSQLLHEDIPKAL